MWNAGKIKALRSRFGETQERFAERIGVAVQTVRYWEQGHGKPLGPTAKLLERLQADLDAAPIASNGNGHRRPRKEPVPA